MEEKMLSIRPHVLGYNMFSPSFSQKKFKDFSYLFLERGKGRTKRGRETSMYGPGPQPRHAP